MEQPRLQKHYRQNVVPKLEDRFGFENPHRVPRVEKVVVNVGLGEASRDHKLLESVVEEITVITGQKPIVTRARKSIANFNVREGAPVGVKVTLRDRRMYEFLDRLVSAAIPRIRDFRGLPQRSFDGRGNYTIGIKEQLIFPEVDIEEVREVHGMDITVVTSTERDDEAFALLREMGFPFRGSVPVQIGADAA
ncbi:MAG: 50S ribosomal protein L5 [Longimicrobiales bacterium]